MSAENTTKINQLLTKIFRCVSSIGQEKRYKLILERSDERVTIYGMTEELRSLNKLIRPTGYITI